MNRITLILTEKGWMARFSDPKVQDIFGTDTIPTPFTAQSSAATVREAIAAGNPGAVVEVLQDTDLSWLPNGGAGLDARLAKAKEVK